jgi:hypothetical protein
MVPTDETKARLMLRKKMGANQLNILQKIEET